jgi:rod shape-determining protein MreD
MTRVLVFTLLGFVLVTLFGPVQQLLRMDLVVFDVPLVIVLYLAMSGRGSGLGQARFSLTDSGVDWTGGLVAVTLGYVSDVLGGGVKGLHCFTLVVVFLLAHRAARKVYLAGALPVVVVTFFASVVASFLGLGIRWIGDVSPTPGSLMVVLAQALLTAAVAPPMLRLCRLIDARLAGESAERGLSQR